MNKETTPEKQPLAKMLKNSIIIEEDVDKIQEKQSNVLLRVETLNNTLLEFTRRSQQSYLDLKSTYENGLDKLKTLSSDLLSIFSRIRKMRCDLAKAFPDTCTKPGDDIIE